MEKISFYVSLCCQKLQIVLNKVIDNLWNRKKFKYHRSPFFCKWFVFFSVKLSCIWSIWSVFATSSLSSYLSFGLMFIPDCNGFVGISFLVGVVLVEFFFTSYSDIFILEGVTFLRSYVRWIWTVKLRMVEVFPRGLSIFSQSFHFQFLSMYFQIQNRYFY